MLIHNKDDIKLVTEFPCCLGHPVGNLTIMQPERRRNSYPCEMLKLTKFVACEIQGVPTNMGIQ